MAKRRVHTDEQINAFLSELENQTDRGAALIAAAVLDEILEVFITARLLEVGRDRHDALFGRGKPLNSFSAKMGLGYALGLYTNAARTQLEMIREVRNKFAHRIEPLDFNHPLIVKEITSRRLKSTPKGEPPRKEFIGIFASIAAALYGLSAADVRLKPLSETHIDYLRQMAEAVLAAHAKSQEIRPTTADSFSREGAIQAIASSGAPAPLGRRLLPLGFCDVNDIIPLMGAYHRKPHP